MGSNGYRSGHHPPTPEVLDICDRFGMLVWMKTVIYGAQNLESEFNYFDFGEIAIIRQYSCGVLKMKKIWKEI